MFNLSTLSGINLQTDNYFQYTSNAFAFQVKRKYVSGKTSKRFHTNVKAFFAPDELP
jgi:fumarate reductase subunit C